MADIRGLFACRAEPVSRRDFCEGVVGGLERWREIEAKKARVDAIVAEVVADAA